MAIQTNQNDLNLVGLVGGIATSYAMWGGASVQNVGKAVIHFGWGTMIAVDAARIILPRTAETQDKTFLIKRLALGLIAYFSTMKLYNSISPELSPFRWIVVAITTEIFETFITNAFTNLSSVRVKKAVYDPREVMNDPKKMPFALATMPLGYLSNAALACAIAAKFFAIPKIV